MSESAVLSRPAMPAGEPYFEQRIFMWSPFGTLGTTILIFALLYGLYLVSGFFEGAGTIVWSARGTTFENGSWAALVLSLLISASLGMQRYARQKDADDYERFAPIFTGGEATALRLSQYTPDDANLMRSTATGLLVGIGISIVIVNTESLHFAFATLATTLWIVSAILLLSVLFSRGAELSRKASASFARTLRDELKIDLLRTDKLSVIGRSAARTALIWIVVSAVASLFFVGGDISIISVSTMAACAAMGIIVFLRAIMGVHQRIRAAKVVELEHVRDEIDRARTQLRSDPNAAVRVQGLLAYETRIDEAPEWPFDQSTLVRVAASTLIVTIPWFGQAIAGYFIEHLAR